MSPVDTPQLFVFEDVWRDNVGMAAIVPIGRRRFGMKEAASLSDQKEEPRRGAGGQSEAQ